MTLPSYLALPHPKLASLPLLSLCLFTLSCATGNPPSGPTAGPQLHGRAHGGQQPVTGASIQLFAAGTSGYGIGATSLLSTPVLTDSSGNFSISGYTCPSPASQLYLVVTGGNPGLTPGTNNPSLALMAALGPCNLLAGPSSPALTTFVNIDEVTTVASVYALAGFMDSNTSQIGASTTNAIGIANSFATVNNLVDTATGQARAITLAGNGTVPQAEINTLGDILAPCINSSGSGPACTALFAAATPTGGAAPTNTLQAALSIAQHPASQVTALYAQGSAFAPFQPTLPAAPNDWALAVSYTGGGLSNSTGIAIDGPGNVWIANSGFVNNGGSVTELSNSGAILSGPNGLSAPGGIGSAYAVAIDPDGNAWVAAKAVYKFSSSGTLLSGANGFTAPGLNGLRDVAIDGDGDAWIPSYDSGSSIPANVLKFANDGTVLSPPGGFTTAGPSGIAIDSAGNAWVTSDSDGKVFKFSSTGTDLSGGGYIGGTTYFNPGAIAIDASGNAWTYVRSPALLVKLSPAGTPLSGSGFVLCTDSPRNAAPPQIICGSGFPSPIAFDGSGNAWVPSVYSIQTYPPYMRTSYFGIEQLAGNGTVLSGADGYTRETFISTGLAVDSSGNVWASSSFGQVLELVGVATPVTTPLSVGVRDKKLATRP